MDDKSAFPHPELDMSNPGMTYREWQWTMFAAAAIPVYASKEYLDEMVQVAEKKGIDPDVAMARCACDMADAMLAAIEEREKQT